MWCNFQRWQACPPNTSLSYVTSGIFYHSRFMKPWCHCRCHPSIGCLGDIQDLHCIATKRIHTLDLHCVNLTLFPLIILAPHIFLPFFFCLLVSAPPPPPRHTHTPFFLPLFILKSYDRSREEKKIIHCMVKAKIKAALAYSRKKKRIKINSPSSSLVLYRS